MTLDLDSLAKAIASFEASIQHLDGLISGPAPDESLINTVRSGVIQNFEFTYELAWKNMQKWLSFNSGSSKEDGLSRRDLFRRCAENGLIDNPKSWFDYHEARNKTSHTYRREIAEEVVMLAPGLLSDAGKVLKTLLSKND